MAESLYELQGEDEEWEDEEAGAPEAEPAPAERIRIVTNKRQEPLRIDKFLMNRVEGATRNKIQQALEEGFITVNGGAVKPNYKIRPGDEIVVLDNRRPESLEVVPEELP